MKRFVRALFLSCVTLVSLAASCRHDPPEPEPLLIDTSYDIPGGGSSITINLTATQRWSASVRGGDKWCTLDRSSGEAGTVSIQIDIAANDGYTSRECTVNIVTGKAKGIIKIIQAQRDVLLIEPGILDISEEGGQFKASITANIEYLLSCDADWLSIEEVPAAEPTLNHSLNITAAANESPQARFATIHLEGGELSCSLAIEQKSAAEADPLDGIVTTIQTHSLGAGIPIVIMGDGFPVEDIESGSYQALMDNAAGVFFSQEPFSSFRELFDVYSVSVVSAPYDDSSASRTTTLGTWFGEGTLVGGDLQICRKYTLKAIEEEELDKSLTIVLMNRHCHAGRCYMTFVHREDETPGYCARGEAYAFIPLGTGEDDFSTLLLHEAGGHGFGKLADEYCYEDMGTMPGSEIATYSSLQTLSHAYMNVCFDAEAPLWSRFLEDERYQWDDLGVLEGACTYPYGVWRPSENSIMNSAPSGFNAPSREAIWLRLHFLAYGSEWEYDYESFAEYDVVNRAKAPDEPGDSVIPYPETEMARPPCRRCVVVY